MMASHIRDIIIFIKKVSW